MQVVILAGGLSRRLGGTPKAGLVLHGQTLLARTVDAAAQFLDANVLAATADGGRPAGAGIAVVGPGEQVAQWLETARSRNLVTVVQEDPPHSGPAAGIAAGLSVLPDQGGKVLVLACDMPHAAELLGMLVAGLAAAPEAAGVMANDAGRAQPLAAIYPERALRDAVEKAREAHRLQNASVFSLLASVLLMDCVVPAGLAADIDTWEDARVQGIARGTAAAEGWHLENHDELLQQWTQKLLEAFEIADIEVDIHAVLNVAGVAAHSVVRPAAPLTTFVAGLAAGLAAGSGQAPEAAAMKAALGLAKQLAAAQATPEPEPPADRGPASGPSGSAGE